MAAKKRLKGFLDVSCRVISFVTLPAFLSIALSVLLACFQPDREVKQFVMLGLFTGLIPALAYPFIILARRTGLIGGVILRCAEYIASAVGFTGGVIYALIRHVPADQMIVYSAHLLCLIFLLLFNTRLPLRAGMHTCLSVCPIVLALVLLNESVGVVVGASLLLFLMLASSVYQLRILFYRVFFGLICAGAGILAAIFGVGNIYQ